MTNIENFKKAVETIEFCADLQISDKDGKILQLGMMLSDDGDVSFNHIIGTDLITLNIKNVAVLVITPDSPIIEAFKDLVNCIDGLTID